MHAERLDWVVCDHVGASSILPLRLGRKYPGRSNQPNWSSLGNEPGFWPRIVERDPSARHHDRAIYCDVKSTVIYTTPCLVPTVNIPLHVPIGLETVLAIRR